MENPFCYIHLYEDIIPYEFSLDIEEDEEIVADDVYYSKLIASANKLRKVLMVYDYALGKLREIDDVEERKMSPYFEAKFSLEASINSGDLDIDFEELGFSDKLIEKLNKRCEYLAYAGQLEWKGVIKLSTMNKFHTIDALEKYVQENNLRKKGEGKIGSKVVGIIGKADQTLADPLAYCREIDNELEHFQSSRKLKSEKVLKLADELDKENEIAYEFACYAVEVSEQMKLVDSKSPQYEVLSEEYQKSIDIFKENGSRISLIASVDDFDFEM